MSDLATPITYFALSQSELDRLIRQAQNLPDMMQEREVAERFSIKPTLLKALVDEGKLTPHKIDPHRAIYYRVADIQKLFKPIQS